MNPIWAIIIAFFLGMCVAFFDLVSTFTKESLRSAKKFDFWLFLLGNSVSAAIACLVLIKMMKWSPIKAGFAAGLGLQIILRSKIFTFKIKGEETPIGPDFLYQKFVNYFKRQIDKAGVLKNLELYKILAPFSLVDLKEAVRRLTVLTELDRDEIKKDYDLAGKLESEDDKRTVLEQVLIKHDGEYIKKFAELYSQESSSE
ncbi:hypothetical protein FJZ31_20730 [Candidatus Poribacteria bacterium]|nr:hypothetical protein [Candidatus Poribacteria bacterium]